MDLQNATAVCLISLFSATLVVMIARALDDRTAQRLEPQLAAIVEELQAIRNQGGMIGGVPTSEAQSHQADLADGVIVYYFHGNMRCPTCQAIESQAHDVVKTDFGAQLGRGELQWTVLNYEQPSAAALTKKFDIQAPVVVLARMKGGQVDDWKRLDEVWALWNDKPAFAQFVRDAIRHVLDGEKRPSSADAKLAAPKSDARTDLPVPAATADLPVPK